MTWISLICLLALSSTAFGRAAFGGGYGSLAAYQQTPRLLSLMRAQALPQSMAAQAYAQQQQQPLSIQWSTPYSYGQQQQQDTSFPKQISNAYGSSFMHPAAMQRTLPVQGYGAMPSMSQFDQQAQIQPAQPVTQADITCRGQQAETVIPLENGWKFIVCLADGKGVEQQCPKGLYYNVPTQRCERKLGQTQNLCASQPCLNGGQCLLADSTYQCQCQAGYDGKNCELDARICQTQNPCGQTPDTKCQSFRWGAALQYICIFQNGLAYGLSSSQIVSSPCQDADGPHALAITSQGFIMCDGERMHIESCPGGTTWDDANKACTWPDMQVHNQQFDQSQGYGQQSYGQKSHSQQSYGQQQPMINQPANADQWSFVQQIQKPKQLQPFNIQSVVSPQFDNQKQSQQSYNAQPFLAQQVQPIQSYGSQFNTQQPKQIPQSFSSHAIHQQSFEQKPHANQFINQQQLQPSQSYGAAQTIVPQQAQQIQPTQQYATAQTIVPQQAQQIQPSQQYATAQTIVPQQAQQIQSFAAKTAFPQQAQQTQSYATQTTLPQQAQPSQQYATAQTVVPQQPQQIQSFAAQTTFSQQAQPSQSYASIQTAVPQQAQQIKPVHQFSVQQQPQHGQLAQDVSSLSAY